MAQSCLCIDQCLECSKDTEIDISRINIGPFLIICMDPGGDSSGDTGTNENMIFFIVKTGQCLYEALQILSEEGIDVQNNCVICRVYDLPISIKHFPVLANA